MGNMGACHKSWVANSWQAFLPTLFVMQYKPEQPRTSS